MLQVPGSWREAFPRPSMRRRTEVFFTSKNTECHSPSLTNREEERFPAELPRQLYPS